MNLCGQTIEGCKGICCSLNNLCMAHKEQYRINNSNGSQLKEMVADMIILTEILTKTTAQFCIHFIHCSEKLDT